jgi:hypothetical protein
MNPSCGQLILAEMLARLNGTALGALEKPTGLVFDRSRLRGLNPTQLPAGSIYPLNETPQGKGFSVEESFVIKIVLWEKGSGATPIDQDLDPIWLWTHQQVMTDQSLGGLCQRIEPVQKIWGFDLAQAPFGDLDLHYLITYRHQAADPTRP